MSLNQVKQVKFLEGNFKRINENNWVIMQGISAAYNANTGIYPTTNSITQNGGAYTIPNSGTEDLYEEDENGITIFKYGKYRVSIYVKFQTSTNQNNCKIELLQNGLSISNYHIDSSTSIGITQTRAFSCITELSAGKLLTIGMGTTIPTDTVFFDWGIDVATIDIF